MSAAWLLYYAMVAAHICGLSYALVFGRAVHRSVAVVIGLDAAIQISICAAAAYGRVHFDDIEVPIDILDNSLMCIALLALSLRYKRDNWLIAILLLNTCLLALDGLVFDGAPEASHLYFPSIANLVNILIVSVLIVATRMSRLKGGALRAG